MNTSVPNSMPQAATTPMGTAPPVSTFGQPTQSISVAQPSTTVPGNQPVPEEKLNARQQRQKAEILDHKAAGEQNLEREEKLEISGKDARYMMMQKLARGSPVSYLKKKNKSKGVLIVFFFIYLIPKSRFCQFRVPLFQNHHVSP